ncbi:MAG: hypothetical protein KatS3mg094_104 [Candidatus Parcubacteria bacterium]|nr:MAG: hypothetical protein KatS3mg094_104 [Candidatus Parcubacteria bacterium]
MSNLNISKIKVLISGNELDFKNFKTENIKAVIDLSDLEPSNYNISINRNNLINLPKSIEVLNIDPDKLKFKIIEINEEINQ